MFWLILLMYGSWALHQWSQDSEDREERREAKKFGYYDIYY